MNDLLYTLSVYARFYISCWLSVIDYQVTGFRQKKASNINDTNKFYYNSSHIVISSAPQAKNLNQKIINNI